MSKLMTFEKAPVPVDPAQWPEARSFQRVYSGHPENQARLVMALFGFRQDLLEWAHDEETATAVEVVLRTFYQRHPEFMKDGYIPDSDVGTGIYHVDERLRSYMARIGIQSDCHIDPDTDQT
jgi:hypothetical protein